MTIADFQAAGFFKILQPRRYGGYEMDPEVFYEVQMKVAEGCMSSARAGRGRGAMSGSSRCSIRRRRKMSGAKTRPR